MSDEILVFETAGRTDPGPSGLAADTRHLGNASRQYAAKSAGECRSRKEQGHTEATLVSLVPLGDIVIDSWK